MNYLQVVQHTVGFFKPSPTWALVIQLPLSHFYFCKEYLTHIPICNPSETICSTSCILMVSLLLVCHQFPIWHEYTFIYVNSGIASHKKMTMNIFKGTRKCKDLYVTQCSVYTESNGLWIGKYTFSFKVDTN